MIDIHAHILPGFDDGARTFAEAAEMACQALEDGITEIVATPHVLDPDRTPRERIITAALALQDKLDADGIAVRIRPGAENHIRPDLPLLVREEKVMTLCDAGRYLLLELPLRELPLYTEQVVFDLLTLGVTPIIAHPERQCELARDPRKLEALVRRGCLAQISTGSVRGRFGREARRAAEIMLTRGLAHVLATDGHGADRRRIAMAEAGERVAGLFGDEFAAQLTAAGPEAIVRGRALECRAPASRARTARWFWHMAKEAAGLR